MKVLDSICQQIWKTQQWPRDWKSSVFIPVPKKANAKEYSNYCTIALISCVVKVMLKILQDRFQQYWTKNFQRYKLGLEKAEKPEVKSPISVESAKARWLQEKHLLLLHWLHESLTVWITTNLKILKEMRIPDHLCCLLQNMQVKKQQNEAWNNGLVQNWERSRLRLYIVTPLI